MTASAEEGWSQAAETYAATAGRFTTLFARDLLVALAPHLKSAKAILDLGCGSGVFEEEYLRLFPEGIADQTIIATDFSPKFVEMAEENVGRLKGGSCKTAFDFRVADMMNLKGIDDGSVDVIVSVFGILIIRDRNQALSEARRVLKSAGVIGLTSWTDIPEPQAMEKVSPKRLVNVNWTLTTSLFTTKAGFGGSLQLRVMDIFSHLVPPEQFSGPSPIKEAFHPDNCLKILSAAGFARPKVHRCVHTVIFPDLDNFWAMVNGGSGDSLARTNKLGPQKLDEIRKACDGAFGVKPGAPVPIVTAANCSVGYMPCP